MTDDVKVGLNPFAIINGSEDHCTNNIEISCTDGLLSDWLVSIMYANLETLKVKELYSLPIMYHNLEKCLGMYDNLLGVTLEEQHMLCKTYQK